MAKKVAKTAKTKRKALKKSAAEARKLEKLKKRGQSDWIDVRNSVIHGHGVYAAKNIPEETRIIEYVGERIDKEESERRAWAQIDKAKQTGDAAVYIFTLNDDWDLDGSVEWNHARLLNHSCDPNCVAYTERDRIFIYALRDIKKGEELCFDYGFDIESYEDHPCLCGADACVGYIVSREQWDELKILLEKKGAKKKMAKKAKKAPSA